MALIGKIREKSWLLVLIVGLALLAFILTDYKSFMGGIEEKYGIGTVYGNKINPDVYQIASQNYRNSDAQSFQQQQREYTSRDAEQSDSKAFRAIVDSILLEREFDALGISVSERELDAYLYGENGFDVLPDIAQSFTNPQTGQFDKKMLQQRVDELKSSKEAKDVQAWEDTKRSLIARRRQEKYFSILQSGLYVTNLEAKNEYVAKNEVKSVAFAYKRINEIRDEEIKVTDDEVKAFYEKHKEEKKYENRSAMREIKYFTVDVFPSKEDSMKLFKTFDGVKKAFTTNTSKAQDSVTVMKNSDERYFVSQVGYRMEGDEKAREPFTYPPAMDSVFKNAAIGTVVGPYIDKGTYRMAKVIDRAGQLLSARHLLISAQRADSAAVKKARKTVDSLMLVINKDNFEQLVAKHSQDPGSKDNGGKYEDFIASEMVKEFSDYATNSPIGKIGYVQTDFGFHIMEVLDRKSANLPMLAMVTKKFKPSPTTNDLMRSEVHGLLGEVMDKTANKSSLKDKIAAFDTLAQKKGYFARSLNLNEENISVYGMNTPIAENKLIELGFDEGYIAGDIYPNPIKDGDRYVIAMLVAKKEKGVPTFEDAEMLMKADLVKEKKEKKIIAQMTGKSVDEVATMYGAKPTYSDWTFAAPSIEGAGLEPKVVGMVFGGLKDGQRSLPYAGNNAVFVVQVMKTKKAPSTTNYKEEKEMLRGQLISSAQGEIMNALKKQAEVVDNRKLYSLGIRR